MKLSLTVQELSQVISWINPPRDRPTPDECDLWDDRARDVAMLHQKRIADALAAIDEMIREVPDAKRGQSAACAALLAIKRILLGNG